MIKHRAIIITESENYNKGGEIFRSDFKFNGYNFIEKDIFISLIDMEKKGLIDRKKIFNMFKLESGLNIIDIVNVITSKTDEWKILDREDIKE